MQKEDKEDVIRFGQNVHTTQTFSKKETLKRPVSSLEGSITKLLTPGLSGGPRETARYIAKKRTMWAVHSEPMLGRGAYLPLVMPWRKTLSEVTKGFWPYTWCDSQEPLRFKLLRELDELVL